MDLLARLHGLSCAEGDRSECKGTCEHMAGEYLGEHWERCPVKDIERDHALGAAMDVRRQAQMAPIAGFPDCLAAWVLPIWEDVDAAFADRRVERSGAGGSGNG